MISTPLAGQGRVIPDEWALEMQWEDRAPTRHEGTRAEDKNKVEDKTIAAAGANLVRRRVTRGLTAKIAEAVQISILAHRDTAVRAHGWIAQILPALARAEMKNAAVTVAAGNASLLLPASGMTAQWLEGEIDPMIAPTIGQIIVLTTGQTIGRANRSSSSTNRS